MASQPAVMHNQASFGNPELPFRPVIVVTMRAAAPTNVSKFEKYFLEKRTIRRKPNSNEAAYEIAIRINRLSKENYKFY